MVNVSRLRTPFWASEASWLLGVKNTTTYSTGKSCSSPCSVPQDARSRCSSLCTMPQCAPKRWLISCSGPQERSERHFEFLVIAFICCKLHGQRGIKTVLGAFKNKLLTEAKSL